jgi:hypothetical protein
MKKVSRIGYLLLGCAVCLIPVTANAVQEMSHRGISLVEPKSAVSIVGGQQCSGTTGYTYLPSCLTSRINTCPWWSGPCAGGGISCGYSCQQLNLLPGGPYPPSIYMQGTGNCDPDGLGTTPQLTCTPGWAFGCSCAAPSTPPLCGTFLFADTNTICNPGS